MYKDSIDFVKGILIVLVVLGHILHGTLDETLSRYFIYSFHMPLFIGISGYLVNFENLKNYKKNQLQKMCTKIFVPYIIAVLFYGIFVNAMYIYKLEYKIFLERFIKNILYSYYHLWYIQGYFSYVFLTYFFIKKKYTNLVIVIVSSIVSLIVYLLYYEFNIQNYILKIFLNNFRMYNFIFFISGYLIRTNKIILKNNLRNFIIFICLFILNSICIYFLKTYRIFSIIVFYLGNIYTIFYVLSLIDRFKNLKINLINKFGKNSLYIYLYHMIPIII